MIPGRQMLLGVCPQAEYSEERERTSGKKPEARSLFDAGDGAEGGKRCRFCGRGSRLHNGRMGHRRSNGKNWIFCLSLFYSHGKFAIIKIY